MAERASPSLEAIGEEFYKPEHFPVYKNLLAQEAVMKQLGVKNPYFNCHTDVSRNTVTIDGQSYINYGGYNYLGLSGDPEVNAAVIDAVERYGTSVSASRIVSGEIPLHRELEAGLAAFHRRRGRRRVRQRLRHQRVDDRAPVRPEGSAAARQPDSQQRHDRLHPVGRPAACRSRTTITRPSNGCCASTGRSHERVCILSEGVYSMDGDIPDLRRLIAIKEQYKALLMVDEAHSAGTIGATGRGIAEYCDVDPTRVDIWMGTLSKTFASCGGYIAGCRALTLNLRYAAPGGILYSVGISPANAAAALAALRKVPRVTGPRQDPHRQRAAVRVAREGGGSRYGAERRLAGRAGDREQLHALPQARRPPLQGRHQRAADVVSGGVGRSVAAPVLHHRAAYTGPDSSTRWRAPAKCCARSAVSASDGAVARVLERVSRWMLTHRIVVDRGGRDLGGRVLPRPRPARVQERLPDVLQQGESRAAGVRIAAKDVHQGRQHPDRRDAAAG